MNGVSALFDSSDLLNGYGVGDGDGDVIIHPPFVGICLGDYYYAPANEWMVSVYLDSDCGNGYF